MLRIILASTEDCLIWTRAVRSAQLEGDATWAWILPLVFLVFLAAGLWLRSRGQGKVQSEKQVAAAVEPRSRPRKPAAPVEALTPASLERPSRPDELEIIEGINPVIADRLRRVGIVTFRQLAKTSPEQLSEVLRVNRLKLVETTSWPEQASLAAEARWGELQQLQQALREARSR